MDIPCISIEADIHGISMDIPCIFQQYIPSISMDIHGISFHVYTLYIHGISMDIPGYSQLSETRFLCLPNLLLSFNAHTCVGDQEYFIPRATMATVLWGKSCPQKAHFFFLFPAGGVLPAHFVGFGAAGFAAASSSSPSSSSPSSSSSSSPPPPPPPPLAAAAVVAALRSKTLHVLPSS